MKRRLAMLTAAAAVLVGTLAFSSSAFAYPNRTSSCTSCHGSAADTVVTATLKTNDGIDATYDVGLTSTGGGLQGWAVLDGSTNVANASAATGSFTVPVGKTYTVWAVDTNSGANSIAVSPIAPVTPPSPGTTTPPSPGTTTPPSPGTTTPPSPGTTTPPSPGTTTPPSPGTTTPPSPGAHEDHHDAEAADVEYDEADAHDAHTGEDHRPRTAEGHERRPSGDREDLVGRVERELKRLLDQVANRAGSRR